MRKLKSLVVCSAALLGATGAFGGVAGSVTVSVQPILSPAVATYTDTSTGFKGTVGYRIDIQNQGNNTNNNVRFTAQTYVTDGAELATYDFDSAEGATCTAAKGPTAIAIDCAIGTLSSGQSFPTFYVFLKSPVFVGNGVADGVNQDFVTFNHQVFFAEGGKGPKSTPKNGFTALTAAPAVVLGTPDPTLVRSVVLAGGGTFFTGNQGIANVVTSDIHATKSVVPPLTTHTTAEILETGVACTSPNVFTCYSSQITIPGAFNAAPYLTTRITQAIENIKTQTVTVVVPCWGDDDKDDGYRTSLTSTSTYPQTCTKTKTQLVPIEQIVVKYQADATAANPNPPEQTVGLCAPLVGPPPVGVPCITGRTVVDNLLGKPIRYEWAFISAQNGRLAIN